MSYPLPPYLVDLSLVFFYYWPAGSDEEPEVHRLNWIARRGTGCRKGAGLSRSVVVW